MVECRSNTCHHPCPHCPCNIAALTCLDHDVLGLSPAIAGPAIFTFSGPDVVENEARFADSTRPGHRCYISRRDGRVLLVAAWHVSAPNQPQIFAVLAA